MARIWNDDFYLGAALHRIVEHPSFKALNKPDSKYGHFLINADRRVLMKHSKADTSPWQFTFTGDDLKTLADDAAIPGVSVFLVLVCGDQAFCALDQAQFESLIDLDRRTGQRIMVEYKKGHSLRASGSLGKLARPVPHNVFPRLLLTY